MMRLLLAAAFIMTAAAGSVFAEGRYQMVAAPQADRWGGVWILDTETGQAKYCWYSTSGNDLLHCSTEKDTVDE
jgi:hypothetical protein